MELKKPLCLAAALLCAAAVANAAQPQSVKINGKEIPQSRIEAVVKARVAQGQPDTPQLRNNIKDAMITQEILPTEVTVAFSPTKDRQVQKVRCRVMRCNKIKDGFYDIGATFLRLEAKPAPTPE